MLASVGDQLLQSDFSRREACLAAIGMFLGTLSVGRSTPARQRDTTGIEAIEMRPPAGKGDSADCSNCPTYSFDSKGRLTSAVAPVDPRGQWFAF